MKITLLGAAREVTGSCYYLETEKTKFLVDCGLFQGHPDEKDRNSIDFPFEASSLDFVLLTHAHIDHTGRLPLLVKRGFGQRVYATRPTVELSRVLIVNSGYIHEADAEWENRKRMRAGLPKVEPLYTADEAEYACAFLNPIDFNTQIQVSEDVRVNYVPSGHLLGSASIEIWVDEHGKTNKYVFSGDLGNGSNPLENPPTPIEEADFLIVESTYGNGYHLAVEERTKRLADTILGTYERGGTTIIPAFAVGRTQEIIYDLNRFFKNHPNKDMFKKIPIYIDSPLAIDATKIYRENMDYMSDTLRDAFEEHENPLDLDNLKLINNINDSISLNTSLEPKVIISASGMCDAGRILHHLKHYLWKVNSSIIFTGYQAYYTNGRKILDGEEHIQLLGENIKVNAQIVKIEGFSGHADKRTLTSWVSTIKGLKKVIISHGEPASSEHFAGIVETLAECEVLIPELNETVELL